MANRVSEVMTPNPAVLNVTSTINDAARLMRDSNIGTIIVRNEQGVCGIVTDRDLVIRGIAEGQDPAVTTLDKVYSEHLATLSPDDSIDNAIELMRKKAVRRAPVVQDSNAVGVVSLGDLAVERDPESALGRISAAPPNR